LSARATLAALAAVVLFAAHGSASAQTTAFRWPFQLDDAVGDASGGLDVTKVEKGGDTTARVAGLRLTMTGFAADSGFDIYLNTDLDFATGSKGAEYVLIGEDDRWWFEKADGAGGFAVAPHTAVTRTTWGDDTYEFHINPADIGGATYFDFRILTFRIAPGNADPQVLTTADRAPDSGWYQYALGEVVDAPHPAPAIHALGAQPRVPHVAKPFTMSYSVVDPETEGPASAAKVTVTMTVAGRRLASRRAARRCRRARPAASSPSASRPGTARVCRTGRTSSGFAS
jgi:hypothetical protein